MTGGPSKFSQRGAQTHCDSRSSAQMRRWSFAESECVYGWPSKSGEINQLIYNAPVKPAECKYRSDKRAQRDVRTFSPRRPHSRLICDSGKLYSECGSFSSRFQSQNRPKDKSRSLLDHTCRLFNSPFGRIWKIVRITVK